MRSISALAPAKAILIGEHSVNRGHMALAVSVGLYASCTLQTGGESYLLSGAGQSQRTTRAAVLALGREIDALRAAADYAAIQRLAAGDFFAAAKYVLAACGDALPAGLTAALASEIPLSSGLGSGGATFVALALALGRAVGQEQPRQIAAWAQRGDIVAHGGVASGLDTQTSLFGGAIRYTAERQGEPIASADGLALVVGNTGVYAATSDVNGRVRAWLAERPSRMHHFEAIGLLATHAEAALRAGDWVALGRLMNLNQLVLERIGVSCPELEALNQAALGAGALGAKLSGSGGGGIMVALVTPGSAAPVARAITAAGGTAIVAPVGVAGARVRADP